MGHRLRLADIDTHAIDIAAAPACVWEALGEVILERLSRPPARLVAKLTGVRERDFAGPAFPTAGAQVPGFVVATSASASRLRLEGSHRFSAYALDFELAPSKRGTQLSATTQAAFPGALGKLYRRLVIGTRAHRLVIRALLQSVRRRAEQAATV